MSDATIVYLEDDTIIEKCGHNFKMVTGVLHFETYVTGGVGLDLRKQLPTKVHYVAIEPKGGFVFAYDYSNRTIKIYEAGSDSDPLDELGAGDAIGATATDCRIFAIGK